MPSDKLREMEVQANKVFDRYRDVYYGAGSISSVYFWETGEDDAAWAACVLMYKEGTSGTWNSINVVEVSEQGGGRAPRQFQYKLTTTVMLTLKGDADGEIDLSGSLTRQKVSTMANDKDELNTHIANMGGMIEDMEGRLRSTVDVVYFGKTQEVMSYMREVRGTAEAKQREKVQKQVISEMSKAAGS